MADIQKSVGIIFSGDTTDVEAAIKRLQESLDKFGGSSAIEVKDLSTAIDGLGDSASKNTSLLGEFIAGVLKLKGGSEETNAKIVELATAFGRLTVVGAVVATIGAVAYELQKVAEEAKKVEAQFTNLTGSSTEGKNALDFLRQAALRLNTDLGETAEVYKVFRKELGDSEIPIDIANKGFEALARIIRGTDGSIKDAKSEVKAFADIIKDGNIDLKEFDGKLQDVPGAMKALQEVTGKTKEELRELADQGKLNTEVINALIERLLAREVVEVTPIASAIQKIKNELKELAGLNEGGLLTSQLAKGFNDIALSIAVTSAEFTKYKDQFFNLFFTVGQDRTVEGFTRRNSEATQNYEAELKKVFERYGLLKQEGKNSLNTIKLEADAAAEKTGKLRDASKDADAALRALGLDPNQFRSADEIVAQFAKLTAASNSSEEVISGLLVSLSKIGDKKFIDALGEYAKANLRARNDVDGLRAVTIALDSAQLGTLPTMSDYKKQIDAQQEAQKKAAKEAKDAEEKAQKLRIELEKLASNERIKSMEFKVQLDIAKVQSDTEKFKATLDSLNKGLESTGQVISAAFGALSGVGGFYGLEKLKIIEEQLKAENDFRKQQFDLQKELVGEQIKRLKAQTEAAERGESIIKIDGSGLAPQLEAFMFEVLRAIQVRVTNDGLPLLLGI